MINNDILRSLRYTFDFSDQQIIEICALGGQKISRDEVCALLKRDDNPAYMPCRDEIMISFLDGLISRNRDQQDYSNPIRNEVLSNNTVLRKLKIALSLQSDDLLALLESVDIKCSKHELSALFRKKDHKNYRNCNDQLLRYILKGLQKKYRP